jgi:ketosteroid isomerase-like protein
VGKEEKVPATQEPTELHGARNAFFGFTAALGAGDVARAAACFTREGCLVTPDGTAVHGRAGIAAILAQLVARRTVIEIGQLTMRQAGDVALAGGSLTLRSDGPEGTRVAQSCAPTVAIRRIEGSWKIAILAPWAGSDAVG